MEDPIKLVEEIRYRLSHLPEDHGYFVDGYDAKRYSEPQDCGQIFQDLRRACIVIESLNRKHTFVEFMQHYNCEWDTDDILGWDEIRICMLQLNMIKEEVVK